MEKYNYILKVEAGEYYANTLWGLFTEIMKHRFHHLFNHGQWID